MYDVSKMYTEQCLKHFVETAVNACNLDITGGCKLVVLPWWMLARSTDYLYRWLKRAIKKIDLRYGSERKLYVDTNLFKDGLIEIFNQSKSEDKVLVLSQNPDLKLCSADFDNMFFVRWAFTIHISIGISGYSPQPSSNTQCFWRMPIVFLNPRSY